MCQNNPDKYNSKCINRSKINDISSKTDNNISKSCTGRLVLQNFNNHIETDTIRVTNSFTNKNFKSTYINNVPPLSRSIIS